MWKNNNLLNRVRESKASIIDRIPGLTEIEKRTIKGFFKRNPAAESKIDWNNARNLTWEDFRDVIEKTVNNGVKLY